MNKAIIGKKLGMTQVFTADGAVIPVTVVEAGPCAVVQKKTVERDGYNAVQLGFRDVKESKLNKPELGHLKKAGVSAKDVLKTADVRTMATDAVVFAMANPSPEIMPDDAKAGGARIVATGRSDFANQINNVLAFPGIFRGALDARARDINNEMQLAAVYAIAGLVSDDELDEEYILPRAFDKRIVPTVAAAVKKAAEQSGVARV